MRQASIPTKALAGEPSRDGPNPEHGFGDGDTVNTIAGREQSEQANITIRNTDDGDGARPMSGVRKTINEIIQASENAGTGSKKEIQLPARPMSGDIELGERTPRQNRRGTLESAAKALGRQSHDVEGGNRSRASSHQRHPR